ncbi:diguanylate cyclase [Zoogloea sp.]|uniref:diguanylate cyclase domain-containing protein n=1 Tax=Zoogloea sp. TaxID=49181 RepID=UPI0014163C90|nr:MAG: diguanylate cyclase [Zoogloea sp.]
MSHALRLHATGQLTALLCVIVLSTQVDAPTALATWWVALTTSQAVLLIMAHPPTWWQGGAPLRDPLLRHYFSAASALIGGGTWGTLPLVLPSDAPALALATQYAVLGGVTLAGASILSSSRTAFAVFITATLLPLFIQTLADPPPALPHGSLLLGLFVLFALVLNSLLHSTHRRVVRRRSRGATQLEAQQLMLDNAREAIVLTHGHRIQRWNRSFADVMRLPHHAARHRSLRHCLADPEDWQRHARAALEAFDRGTTYQGVTRLRRRDGSDFWAEISGRRIVTGTSRLQAVWVAADISNRLREDARDALAHNQLRKLVEQSSDWYWQTDCEHRLMHIVHHRAGGDERLCRNVGRTWWQFPRSDRSPGLSGTQLREIFEGRQGFRDLRVTVPDGMRPPLHLHLSGTPRLDDHGAFAGYHGTATDVTEQIRSTERIHHLAYHDHLTGLPNRRLLSDRLNQAIAQARRNRERVGIILLDVDDFKRINDLAGHSTGDQILMEIADRLRHAVRSCDSVARLEGDAFVILLPGLDQLQDAEQVAAKVLTALHEPIQRPFPRSPLGASIGIALFPEDADTAAGLLDVADMRMQRAKRRGGQRIEG